MSRAARLTIAAVHFVCPLLFFTDLTRNPYFTQIVLLNLGISAALCWELFSQTRSGEWRIPKTPADIPWLWVLSACALSWLWSYFGHPPFYRDSIRSEGLRVGLFLFVNSMIPFYLAAAWTGKDAADEAEAPFHWAAFILVWASLWTLFPGLKGSVHPASTSLFDHLWDGYGMLVWAAGIAWALWLCRSGSRSSLRHLLLATGSLGALYGIAQYFAVEFFWPKILNPYGGRSVSTFGNPNFMSSYMVMLLPLAAVHYLEASSRARRAVYAGMFLLFEGVLLCSLTRSSWVGAIAALLPLAFSRRLRLLAKKDAEFHGLVLAAVAVLIFFWPQSNVSGYAPSVAGRLAEMAEVFSDRSGSSSQPYSPLYQRLLIWLCCWTMGAENPILGKGWGVLELFYPFYQGHFIDSIGIFSGLRTHANNAHNEIIELFSQAGILGLGAFLWLWTVIFAAVWKAFSALPKLQEKPLQPVKGKQKAKDSDLELPREPIWALAAASSVAGMLADNLLNVSIHFAVPGFLFWWQAGTAVGILVSEEEGRRTLRFPNFLTARAAAALLLVGAVLVGRHWAGQWVRETQYFLGFKYMRQGSRESIEKAIRHLESAHRANDREVNTNYELGNAYARSDRADKAVWAYQEALKANSGYDEIYFNLGTLRSVRLGQNEEAVKDYTMSWVINPLSKQTSVNFASLLLQGDNSRRYPELAEAVLRKASARFPEDPTFMLNLAAFLTMQKRDAEAVRCYEELLKSRPDMGQAESNLRAVAARAKIKEPAILDKLGEYRELARRLAAQLYDERSLTMARRVHADFPTSVQAKFYLGNLEMMGGDPIRAEALLREVRAAEPNSVPVLMNLGQVLGRNRKLDEARAVYQTVLSLDPSNVFARRQIDGLSR